MSVIKLERITAMYTSRILVLLLSSSERSITGTTVGRPCAHRLGDFVHPSNFTRRVHCSKVSLSPNLMAPVQQLSYYAIIYYKIIFMKNNDDYHDKPPTQWHRE